MKKLKGSTIIESITALMIITLITGITLMVVSNQSGAGKNVLHFKAQVEVQQLYDESFENKGFKDTILEKEGLRIELIYKEQQDWTNTFIVTCSVFDIKNNLIYERRWLIPQK